jgi:predicted DNA-binding transcriptional regulator AlpA
MTTMIQAAVHNLDRGQGVRDVARVKAMEILTVDELATLLKMSKRQVYEMTSTRTRTGAMKKNPVPVVRINGNLRFRKVDVEAWLAKLALEAA